MILKNALTRQLLLIGAGAALILAPVLGQGAIAAQQPDFEVIAREMGGMTPEKMEARLQKLAQELKLSPEQVTQLRNLRTQTRTQMDGILSQQQRDTMKATLKEGKGMKAALAAAQVTPQQREPMKKVRQDSKAAMDNILTPEQKTQLKAKMQEMRQKHRGHKPMG